MGGNNIRNGWETVDSFVNKCKILATSFEKLENAQLVFCGMIPSPGTDATSKHVFIEANHKLKNLSDQTRSNHH